MTVPSGPARWWHTRKSTIICDLCPRSCQLAENQQGACGVRYAESGKLWTLVRNAHSGWAVDPIEKKPLYHFLPGSKALSFGTMGCNLACRFCQNWRLSQGKPPGGLQPADPASIVAQAQKSLCPSVAFTYNEPIISGEYGIEVAQACREAGLNTLAISSGYIAPKARSAFFQMMDAANIDLKSFSEAFYRDLCKAHLAPVLETLEYLVSQPLWLEVTNLLIPGRNDSSQELKELARWIALHLGQNVPLHFTAFHPDFRMRDTPPTPPATLHRAQAIAQDQGLRYVYTGNTQDREGSTTHCPSCGATLIEREGFHILAMRLSMGACPDCGTTIPGRF